MDMDSGLCRTAEDKFKQGQNGKELTDKTMLDNKAKKTKLLVLIGTGSQ
jgi:hypothetical protein